MKELKSKFSTKIDFLNRNEWIPPNKNGWSIEVNEYDKMTAYKEPGFTGNDAYLMGQENIFEIGKKYRVTYTVIRRSQGNFWISIGSNNSTLRNSNGTFTDLIECDDYGFKINGSSLFNGGVYDITIEEVTFTDLDISDDTNVTINHSVSDIREIGDKRGSYSYTFSLPQTRNNNKFFGNCFDISEDSKFNIKHRVKTLYMEDGVNVLEGFLQLNNINNTLKTYDVTLFGGVLDFFKKISQKNIQELSFPELDHEYTFDNNFYNWSTGISYGFYDIGQNIWNWNRFWNTRENNLYRGIQVDDIYPCVSAKAIFQKIHDEVGVEWRSDLIESSHFSDIYIPVNKWEHESDWKTKKRGNNNDMTCNVDGYIDTMPLIIGNQWYYLYGTNSTQSLRRPQALSQNWYGAATNDGFIFSPPEGGYFKAKIKFTGSFSNYDSGHPINDFNPVKLEMALTNNLVTNKPNAINNVTDRIQTFDATFFDTGSFEWEVETDEFYLPKYNPSILGYANGLQVSITVKNTSQAFKMNSPYWKLDIDEENISNKIAPSSQITNINELLPDTSQSGFINSLLKQFNLFVTYNQDTNTLSYDTYDSFYSGGTVRRDWEIDYDSDVIISPLNEQMYEKYLFKHLQGGGVYSQEYVNETDEVYGQYEFDNESDFVEGEYVINSNAYSSPLRYMETPKWNNRLYYSSMSKNLEERKLQHDVGLRFLYKNTGNVGSTNYTGIYFTNEYYCMDTHVNGLGTWIYGTYYRSFSHLSDPEALNNFQENEYDLNFGPVEYYDQDMSQGITNENLYNKYWKKYIENLSNKDARMLEAKFNLDSSNMVQFKLNDKVEIDGTYYYVNNLRYNSNGLSTAQLIKTNNFNLDYDSIYQSSNNSQSINYNANQVLGTDNKIDQSSFNNQINGNNNIIGANSYNNTISGDNNIIGNNVRNCIITNSNNCKVGYYNKEVITGATARVSGYTSVEDPFDVQYISILNSDTITLEPSTSLINVSLSNDIEIYSGVYSLNVDNENNLYLSESQVSVIRGTKVKDGEIITKENILNDCGEDTVQEPFTNAHVIDSGENNLSDITYIDSNVVIDGGEDKI